MGGGGWDVGAGCHNDFGCMYLYRCLSRLYKDSFLHPICQVNAE